MIGHLCKVNQKDLQKKRKSINKLIFVGLISGVLPGSRLIMVHGPSVKTLLLLAKPSDTSGVTRTRQTRLLEDTMLCEKSFVGIRE